MRIIVTGLNKAATLQTVAKIENAIRTACAASKELGHGFVKHGLTVEFPICLPSSTTGRILNISINLDNPEELRLNADISRFAREIGSQAAATLEGMTVRCYATRVSWNLCGFWSSHAPVSAEATEGAASPA